MNEFFVRIKEPKKVRRELLESSKETLMLIFDYERIKRLRQERVQELDDAKTLIREIKLLINKLKKFMPNIPSTTEKIKIHTTDYKMNHKTRNKKEQKGEKDKSEEFSLSKIEEELRRIEEKLRGF